MFSAFTALLANFNCLGFKDQNFWPLPPNSSTYPKSKIQLWVQILRSIFLCSLSNTSYKVDFDVANGNQTITSLQTMELGPVLMDSTADGFDYLNPSPYIEHDPYIASLLALCNFSVGNITAREYMFEASEKVPIDESSSFVLRSRLDICEDFTNSL